MKSHKVTYLRSKNRPWILLYMTQESLQLAPDFCNKIIVQCLRICHEQKKKEATLRS